MARYSPSQETQLQSHGKCWWTSYGKGTFNENCVFTLTVLGKWSWYSLHQHIGCYKKDLFPSLFFSCDYFLLLLKNHLQIVAMSLKCLLDGWFKMKHFQEGRSHYWFIHSSIHPVSQSVSQLFVLPVCIEHSQIAHTSVISPRKFYPVLGTRCILYSSLVRWLHFKFCNFCTCLEENLLINWM